MRCHMSAEKNTSFGVCGFGAEMRKKDGSKKMKRFRTGVDKLVKRSVEERRAGGRRLEDVCHIADGVVPPCVRIGTVAPALADLGEMGVARARGPGVVAAVALIFVLCTEVICEDETEEGATHGRDNRSVSIGP